MKHTKLRSFISLALALLMLTGLMPAAALADPGAGLCEHHTEHVGCAYTEGSEAVPCAHVCDDGCYITETSCLHSCDGSCIGEDGLCTHVCSAESGCVITVADCVHTSHDASCGYAEAVSAADCDYFCDICFVGNEPAAPELPGVGEGPVIDNMPGLDADMDAEPELVTIYEWDWASCSALPENGAVSYDTKGEKLSYDAAVALLPPAVSTVWGELLLEWGCIDYPYEGASSGTYLFSALLPVGFILDETAPATELSLSLADSSAEPVLALQPPTITRQIENPGIVNIGDRVSLSIEAEGMELKYRWQRMAGAGMTITNLDLDGADTPTLSFTAAFEDFYNYFRCEVSNSAGTVYSDWLLLDMHLPIEPWIIKQPASVTVEAGSPAIFSIEAKNVQLSYQWQVKAAGSENWVNSGASTAKTPQLRLTPGTALNGYQYRCVVTNPYGSDTSEAVTLTVTSTLAPPVIVSHPASLSASVGESVTLLVSASGNELGYQWQVKVPGSANWANSGISSAKTPALSLTVAEAHNGYQYRCRVSNSAGTVYSNAASITIASDPNAPEILSHPASLSTAPGDAVYLGVSAAGNGLSFRWQVKAPGSANWVNSGISSAGTAILSLTVSEAHNGYQYRCRVSNSFGTVYSNPATLTVQTPIDPPAIVSHPASQRVRLGDVLRLSVSASGKELAYQWQVKAPGSANWANSGISSAKTPTLNLTVANTHNGYQYRCRVYNRAGEVYSKAALISVVAAVDAPEIISQPASVRTSVGDMVYLSVAAAGEDLSFQWQVRPPLSANWVNSGISSAKSLTLSFTAAASHDGYQYRCRVSNSGGTVYSEPATVTVAKVQLPVIGANPSSVTVNEGTSATFTVSASGTGLSYQWQALKPGASAWVNSGVASARTATLTVSAAAAMDGYKYRCAVSNSAGVVYSDAAVLSVIARPVILSQPAPVTVGEGASASFTVSASGTGLSYQWQALKPGASAWVNSGVASAKTTALTVTASASMDGYKYRCAVKNSAGTVYSAAALLTVGTKPVILSHPRSVSAADGVSVTFMVAAEGSNLSYQWQVKAPDSASWVNSGITGAKTASLSFKPSASLDGYRYRCRVSNSFGTVYSNDATLSVIAGVSVTGLSFSPSALSAPGTLSVSLSGSFVDVTGGSLLLRNHATNAAITVPLRVSSVQSMSGSLRLSRYINGTFEIETLQLYLPDETVTYNGAAWHLPTVQYELPGSIYSASVTVTGDGSDTEAPTMGGIGVDRKSIYAGDTIDIMALIYDNISGVVSCTVNFVEVETATKVYAELFEEAPGEYYGSATFTVPGNYYWNEAIVTDAAGNVALLTPGDPIDDYYVLPDIFITVS